jgi:hypothetical protein
MLRKSFVALFLFMLCASVGYAQTPSSTPQRESSFFRRSVTLRLTTIDYRIYIPADYDPAKKYPVILYPHGRGARGNDNEKQIGGAHLGSVIQLFDMKHPERYPLSSPFSRKLKAVGLATRQSKPLKHSTKPSRNLTATRKGFIWRELR